MGDTVSATLATLVDRARRQLRRRGRDEGGFILVLVLGIIALTSIVIVALLGLALTSLKIAETQREIARRQRAADSALESAVGQIARYPGNDPCLAIPEDNELTFDDDPSPDRGEIAVRTECEPVLLTDDGDGSSDRLGGPRVEVVGDDYGGAVEVPGGLSASPTLVHRGDDALAFTADVVVRRGAAARSTAAEGPGIHATGQYAQGDTVGGGGCGPLAPGGGDPGAEVHDRDQEPECGSSEAATLTPRTGTLFGPGEETALEVADVPGCSGLVRLQPGRYNAVATSQLNELLGGGCSGATFWFEPGRYYFDVSDPNASEEERHALVIDDASIRLIFGEPAGGDALSAEFPRACDPTVPGASLQLSGRTSILHRAGRVAICPAWSNGTILPAIVQSDLAPSQPVLVSTQPELPFSRGFSSSSRSVSFTTEWTSPGHAPLHNAELQFRSIESPPVHEANRTVRVDVNAAGVSCSTGAIPAGRTSDLYTRIDLTSAGGCAGALSGVDTSVFDGATITVTHEYSPPENVCNPFTGTCVRLTVSDVRLRTNIVDAEGTGANGITWSNIPAVTTMGAPKTDGLHGDPCLLIPGDVRCRLDQPKQHHITVTGIDPTRGGRLAPTDHVESLGVQVDSMQGSPSTSWAAHPGDSPNPWLRFELIGPAGTCVVQHPGFSRSNTGVHVDLFDSGGTCRGMIDTVADLVGAQLRMTIQTGCILVDGSPIRDPFNAARCNVVRLPDLDRIALSVTSDTVSEPTHSVVTVDAGAGTSFTVFGDTLMPRTDLDVHWRGEATALPVFGGHLSIRSVGSEMHGDAQMGVLCCSPPATTALRAYVDDRVAAVAHVVAGGVVDSPPAGGPVRSVAVLDWRYCAGGRCTTTPVAGSDPDG